eukprot:scaffold11331_cov101-Isochrysis_galbana.AAC.2
MKTKLPAASEQDGENRASKYMHTQIPIKAGREAVLVVRGSVWCPPPVPSRRTAHCANARPPRRWGRTSRGSKGGGRSRPHAARVGAASGDGGGRSRMLARAAASEILRAAAPAPNGKLRGRERFVAHGGAVTAAPTAHRRSAFAYAPPPRGVLFPRVVPFF